MILNDAKRSDLNFFGQEWQELSKCYFRGGRAEELAGDFQELGKQAYDSPAFNRTLQEELYRLSRDITPRNVLAFGRAMLAMPCKKGQPSYLSEEIILDCASYLLK